MATTIEIPSFAFGSLRYAEILEALIQFKRQNVPEMTDESEFEPLIQLLRAFALVGHLNNVNLDILANTGYRFGLVTSNERRIIGRFLDKHLAERFEVEVFGDEVMRAKPEPDVYRLALDRTGARPNKVIAVEDSINGIRSATSAGLSTIGLAIDIPFGILRLTEAKAVVTSFDELASLILG